MARMLPPAPGDPSDKVFLAWLDEIEVVTAFVCRRSHLSNGDVDDFRSHVKLKLLENDCGVLRKYRGHAAPATFLTIVIHRLLQDFQISRWGKWRPSARAKRLGPIAVLLERLVIRDQRPFEEACEVLRTNHDVKATTAELEAILAKLPRRPRRRFEGDEMLAEVAAAAGGPDARLIDRERRIVRQHLYEALRQALAQLAEQDRLIIMFRFQDGRTVREIADILGLEYKPLFRHIARLLSRLRRQLERDGIDATSVLGDDPIDRDDDDFDSGPGSTPAAVVSSRHGPANRNGDPAVQPSSDEPLTSVLTEWCEDEEEKQWPVRL